jgi:hypothetical protein
MNQMAITAMKIILAYKAKIELKDTGHLTLLFILPLKHPKARSK